MNNTQTVSIVAGAAVILAVAFPMFAPEPRLNAVKESYRIVFNDDGQRCLDHFRPTFVDPESIRLVESGGAWVKIRAANRSGGFGFIKRACVMSGGQVDEGKSSHMETIAILNAQIACLKQIKAKREASGPNVRQMNADVECSEEAVRREVTGE